MSLLGDIRNLAEVLDPKSGANPQALIRSLLNSFPDDFELDGTANVLSDSTNRMNFDDDDQHSGLLTPIQYDRSSQPSTPSLSLPDSFNVDVFDAVNLKRPQGKAPGRFPTRQSDEKGCQR